MSYVVKNQVIFLDGSEISLSPSENTFFKTHVVQRWSDLARRFSSKYNFPIGWLLAIIYAESGGNPKAFRTEPTGQTGVGLMQITDPGLKHGLSDDQVMDPETNLDIGVRYLSNIKKNNPDLPAIASCYNCGCPKNPYARVGTPWGICEAPGYLERVSAASNSYLRLFPAPRPSAVSLRRAAGTMVLAVSFGLGVRALLR